MARKIRDVMSTDLVQLNADQTVTDAARSMRDRNVGDVLVMRDGALTGILTDRDIVVRCVADGVDPAATPAEDVCSQALTTLSPEEDSALAVKAMAKKAVRRLPVVENGKPVGIVSLGDLAEDRDRSSALGQISASAPNR